MVYEILSQGQTLTVKGNPIRKYLKNQNRYLQNGKVMTDFA